jgi:ATP-dependent DNA ligase
LQQRLTASRRRVAELAATQPATFMAFDVLQDMGVDVRPAPLHRRRARLRRLMAATRPPLQLTPQTDDRAVAVTWMEDCARAAVGIEGLVVKGKADPYQPDQRGWVKVKTRETVEALVAAVVGSLVAPRRLVLGRFGEDGVLHVAGATGELTATHRKELAGVFVAATSPHPWPDQLMLGWCGSRDKVEVVMVEPTVSVEVLADTARDRGRWRHVTRYVRIRVEA